VIYGGAGEDLDAQLDRDCADGRITVDDADQIRTFAAFLNDTGPAPRKPGGNRLRYLAAIAEHYPEDYARIQDARDQRATQADLRA
jgi:hypothetical protein